MNPLEPFAGRYVVTGAIENDECASRLMLAGGHIVIDPSAGTLRSESVNRAYAARVDEGTLFAEGRFSAPDGACDNTTMIEAWKLRRGDDGALEGVLTSTWTLPPCARPCSVRAKIRAVPAKPDAGAP